MHVGGAQVANAATLQRPNELGRDAVDAHVDRLFEGQARIADRGHRSQEASVDAVDGGSGQLFGAKSAQAAGLEVANIGRADAVDFERDEVAGPDPREARGGGAHFAPQSGA